MADRDEHDATMARLVALRPGRGHEPAAADLSTRGGPSAADDGAADDGAADDGAADLRGEDPRGAEASGAEDLLGRAGLRAGLALEAAATAYTVAHGHPLEHPALVGPAGLRWLTRPRVAVVAALALVLLGGGVVGRSLAQGPVVLVSAEPTAPGSGEPSALAGQDGDGAGASGAAEQAGAATADLGGPGEVVVHVVGEVLAPGVVTLPAGSRVVEAIDAVGGATASADLAALNLARVLQDGEQVLVPGPGGEGTGATDGASGVAGSVRTSVDLNTADIADLDALPGIGPVLAQRIVAWRAEHGRFSTVDELGEVTGIGPTVLAGLRDLVRV